MNTVHTAGPEVLGSRSRGAPGPSEATAAETWDLLFERHAPDLLRYLARRVGAAEAEDLLAETFETGFRRRHSHDVTVGDVRPWLFGIASNLLHRHRRAEARFLKALAKESAATVHRDTDPTERLDARLDAGRHSQPLARALVDLRSGDRNALLLMAWAEFSHAEIAEALDIPVGTVKSRIHRARRIVRARLEGEA